MNIKKLVAISLLLTGAFSSVQAANVSVSWTPPTQNCDETDLPATDIAGYEIYFGKKSRGDGGHATGGGCAGTSSDQALYEHKRFIADSATEACTIVNLPRGDWYFSMVAVAKNGERSAYSNEVKKTVTQSGKVVSFCN